MQLAINSLREKRLYKFVGLKPNRRDYISRRFTHGELYMPSPRQLNDPWESKPHSTIGDLSNPAIRESYINYHARIMLERLPEQDPAKVREWLRTIDQEEAEELHQYFYPYD